MSEPGAVALVTGAGSGIGRSVAHALLDEGYRVVLVGRKRAALEETCAGRPDCADRSLVLQADITDAASVSGVFESVARTMGRLDVLFNNAGLFGPAAPIDEYPLDDWLALVNTNLTGSFMCAKSAFALMKAQRPRGGRIINNGSLSAQTPRPHAVAYTATKHGLSGLTRALALEGRAYDIACGQIDIGNAATAATEDMATLALQPDGTAISEPMIDVDHVARAVAYIANLPVDVNVEFMTVMATGMPFVGRG